MANVSGMLILRYSFQFAQTFALPPSLSFPLPLVLPLYSQHLRVYMQIIQDVHAQLLAKAGSSIHPSPLTPRIPAMWLPSCAFLGAKFMQDMPENHEKERGRESIRGRGREEGAHLNVLHVHVAGAVAGSACTFQRGGGRLSIEIMALPVQEKC